MGKRTRVRWKEGVERLNRCSPLRVSILPLHSLWNGNWQITDQALPSHIQHSKFYLDVRFMWRSEGVNRPISKSSIKSIGRESIERHSVGSVCVCVCVCVCARARVYLFLYDVYISHICIHGYIYVCIYIWYIHFTYLHMWVCKCMYLSIHWQSFSPWPNSSQAPLNSLLNMALHCPVLARILHSQCPATLHTCSSSSFSTISRAMSHHPGLPSARILLGLFSQNLPPALTFPLSDFPPTDPQPTPWLNIPPFPCCFQNWARFYTEVSLPLVQYLNSFSESKRYLPL